jgi:anti-sigma-K factor RskA
VSWPIAPAAVALDALDERERPLAVRLLAEDPTFRAEVDRLRATTFALTTLDRTAWEPVPPPPLRDPAVEPRRRERRVPRPRLGLRLPRRRAPLLAAGAAGLAAAAALATALVIGPGGSDETTTLALRALPGASGRASLTISGAAAELRGSGLPPSGEHDYYEAWLADARGRMVSMGTFRVGPDGRVDVHMPVAVDVSKYALVDVSREPDDGDPAHSDTSVLRAKL